jgi:hypothetical protein
MASRKRQIIKKTTALLEMARIEQYVRHGLADEKKATERMRELAKIVTWYDDAAVEDIFWRNGSNKAERYV